MAHEISYVDDSGSEGVAHWQMLLKLKTFAEANGWVTQRYLNPTPFTDASVVRELILKGPGLSGTEEIYIGFRAYQDATKDYYNLTVAAFTGYVPGNLFTDQPGYVEYGACAHNQRIDYALAVNGQRILLAMTIGASLVREVVYTGKFFPYATPSQYPYPVAVMGMLKSGMQAVRYDDTTAAHTAGIKGASMRNNGQIDVDPNGRVRIVDGTQAKVACLPWNQNATSSTSVLGAKRRDTGGYYNALPAVLYVGGAGAGSVLGELDGVRYISGFNLVGGDTATINGKLHLAYGDAFRTGVGDYMLVEMN